MLKMPRQREAKREALLAEVEKMPLNYASPVRKVRNWGH